MHKISFSQTYSNPMCPKTLQYPGNTFWQAACEDPVDFYHVKGILLEDKDRSAIAQSSLPNNTGSGCYRKTSTFYYYFTKQYQITVWKAWGLVKLRYELGFKHLTAKSI